MAVSDEMYRQLATAGAPAVSERPGRKTGQPVTIEANYIR